MHDRTKELPDNGDDFRSLDIVYQELGIKTFSALTNCLDLLGRLGSHDPARSLNAASFEKAVTSGTAEAFSNLQADVREVKEQLVHWESRLSAIEAGLKRIDRFTIEAFRELEEIKREADEIRESEAFVGDRGRLAKEEAARLAIDAGFKMRAEGKRLSLAAVAREAGLKYGQIVYAFGNKDAFFTQLEAAMEEAEATAEDHAV